MPIIIESTRPVFDTSRISKGDFIRAQYAAWDKPWNGLVMVASESELSVLFLPGIGNVSNFFPVKAEEVAAGKWTITWSKDLETVETEGRDDGDTG